MEPKESSTRKNTDTSKLLEADENATILTMYPDAIIDLPKLSIKKGMITNAEIILSILEICTYHKKYNYDCSNNTKAFWDRVVEEGILKKIFKNFKGETLRKYWKVIRQSGNNLKFLEVVKSNEKYINNPSFKLMTLVNAIAYFIQTNETDFEKFFEVFNSKDKKSFIQNNETLKSPINLIAKKRTSPDKNNAKDNDKDNDNPIKEKKKDSPVIEEEIIIKTNLDEKEKQKDIKEREKEINFEEKIKEMENITDFDESINKLMELTKLSKEEISLALFGTSGNIKNAFLYLNDKEKYKKYFFNETEDNIIKNMKDTDEYKALINDKGIELIKEREKFFSI